MQQLAHVRPENILAQRNEGQRAANADKQGQKHVFGIVNMDAAHVGIRAQHCQRHLLERYHAHAHLGGKNYGKDHHCGVALAFFVAAGIAHAVQNRPADDGRGRGRGQAAENENRAHKDKGEEPGLATHKFAGNKPERDEF